MTLTLTTPYKTNTLVSVTGTAFVTNGTPFVGSDVGRYIRMTDGPAQGQVRRINSYVSSSQVTLDFAWNVSPFAIYNVTDSLPVAGNTWVMSYSLADIANGTDIIVTNGQYFQANAAQITLNNPVFVACVNETFSLDSNYILINSTACWMFGYHSSTGITKWGCNITERAATLTQGWSTGGSGGDLRMYRCRIQCQLANSGFWRIYGNGSLRCAHHLIDNTFDGQAGGRIQGTRSIYANNTYTTNTSVTGPINAISPMAAITGMTTYLGGQAAYFNYGWVDVVAASFRAPGGVSNQFALCSVQAGQSGCQYIDDYIESEVSGAPYALFDSGVASATAIFRFRQWIDTKIVDASLANITDYARRVIRNGAGTTVDNTTSNTSAFARYIALIKEFNFAGGGGGQAWSAGTAYGPYEQGICCYGYQPVTMSLPLATSSNLTLTILTDLNITEPNRSTVQAYTSLANLDQLYDAYKSWLVTNFATPWPTFGVQKLTGQGTTLDCGDANIVVDGTAAAAFAANTGTNTITIKSGVFAAGAKFAKLVTTGVISFVNGASANTNLIYRDSSGTSVSVTAVNLISGTRVRLYNETDSVEIDNSVIGAGGYVLRTFWSADKTIRLDAAYANGATAKMEVQSRAILSANGAAFLDTQTDEPVYNANAIDGSSVTEYAADYPNVQIDVSDPDGVTSVQRMYAWYHYIITTSDGIRNFFRGMEAADTANYTIHQNIIDLHLDNISATPVRIVGGYLSRADGTTIIAPTSGSIQMDPLKAYVAGDATANILAVRNLVEADEVHTLTTIQKRQRGTATVLLEKNWTGTPLNNFQAIQP